MINIKENERLNKLNHSCAHLLAQAVKHLYPHAKFWVGPVIEEGFYYDIDLGDETLTEEALEKIEKEMKKIAKDGKRIVRQELTKEEALEKAIIRAMKIHREKFIKSLKLDDKYNISQEKINRLCNMKSSDLYTINFCKIENEISIYFHVLLARLRFNGYGSYFATKKLIKRL